MRQDSDVDDDETWLGRNDVSRGVAYLSHSWWAVKDTISIANIKEAQNICRIVSMALSEPPGARMKTSASSLLCSCQWPSCCGQGGQKYAILNTVEYFWARRNTVEYWIHESFTHQVGSVSALHTLGWIRFTLEKNADDDEDDDNCICNVAPCGVICFSLSEIGGFAPPSAEFDNAKCLRDLKRVYI